MAALALLEDIANRAIRNKDFVIVQDDVWLISRYRLPRTALLELCAQMGPHLQRRTRCNQSGISQSSLSRILPDVRRGIIPLCPQFIRFPYSAQEQRNVKEDFLRKTGFPMASHPDCAHSDSLGSPLQYSTCPCAVGSRAQHRHAEGKVAMFGCIGRETAI